MPLEPGGGSTDVSGSQRQALISYYANQLNSQYPGDLTGQQITIAQAYIRYMQQNSTADPATIYEEIVQGYQELQAVPGTIGEAITAGTSKAGSVAAGVGPATAQAGASVGGGTLSSWLTGFGADIASGLEQGVVSLLSDIWTVIEGPLLVLLGIGIVLVVLAVYFKNDIQAAGGAVAALGRVVALGAA